MSCKSSTLLYGDTGSGKTAQLGSWAKWIRQTTGKKVRLYTAEPGGLATIEHLVDIGLIDVWDITTRPNSFETLDFAARGFWPDAASGKLVAPDGKTFEEFGGFAYEGATAFGEFLLEELRTKGAANEIIGAEKAPQQFTSGSLRVAGANQTFYGIVQARVRKAINDSQRLPGHILWTARELKVRDEDDSKKQFVFGPLLAGQAATLMMPAWFGNTIHIDATKKTVLDPVTKKNVDKLVRKMYLKKHVDETLGVMCLAQLRLPPELNEQMEAEIELDPQLESMVKLFNKMADLREKAKQHYTQR